MIQSQTRSQIVIHIRFMILFSVKIQNSLTVRNLDFYSHLDSVSDVLSNSVSDSVSDFWFCYWSRFWNTFWLRISFSRYFQFGFWFWFESSQLTIYFINRFLIEIQTPMYFLIRFLTLCQIRPLMAFEFTIWFTFLLRFIFGFWFCF